MVFTGTACRADDIPPPHENTAFLAKYGDSLLRVSDSAEEFGAKFPVPLRIEITRTRGHPPGTWRAGRPRPDVLPHFPMVTHRGGFPDGS